MQGSGVYQILHETSGGRYVGSAVEMRRREQEHLSRLRSGVHCNPHLQNAWDLYEEEQFVFSALEHVPDLERLVEREQHYIDTLNPTYNIAPNAGSRLGIPCREATKQKISQALTGRKGHKLSEEHKQKIRESLRGRTLSEEQKRRLSEANKGRTRSSPVSPETRRKLSEALRGERSSGAKLTEQDVAAIKILLAQSTLSLAKIAARYGVDRSTIGYIKRGDTWAHVLVAS